MADASRAAESRTGAVGGLAVLSGVRGTIVGMGTEWLAWTVVRAPVRAPAGLAALTVGVTEVGLAAVCFGAGSTARSLVAEAGRRLGVEPVREDGGERTAAAVDELTGYLTGRRREFGLPVDWRLTHGDQRTVLRALYEQVGYGRTVTYGELAVRSGAYPAGNGPGQAARRVGMIMGSNPVPVVVPCHRVLAADGLGGFGGGLAAKRWLLEREDALPPMLDLWPDGVPESSAGGTSVGTESSASGTSVDTGEGADPGCP